MDYREKIKLGWMHCSVIIEVIGRPKEYLGEVLHAMVDKIKGEKAVIEVIKDKYVEPRERENGAYYTSFVELEFVIKDIKSLQEFVFGYLPSSIEIIGPEEMKFTKTEATAFFNDLGSRLHSYDDVTKNMRAMNMMLTKKLREFKPDISEKDFMEDIEKGAKKNEKTEDKTDSAE